MTPVLLGALVAAAVLLAPGRGAPGVRALPASEAVDPSGSRAATVEEAAAAVTMLAAVLRGGTGAVEALEAVAALDPTPAGRELAVVAAAHRWGVPPEDAWSHVGPGWGAAAAAWLAATAAGAAPAALVEAAADRMRAEECRRTEAAIHRAGVLLVLPLGLCFLPGFVATTVVPVVLFLLLGRL